MALKFREEWHEGDLVSIICREAYNEADGLVQNVHIAGYILGMNVDGDVLISCNMDGAWFSDSTWRVAIRYINEIVRLVPVAEA